MDKSVVVGSAPHCRGSPIMFQQVVLHVFHMLLPRMSKFYTWVMKNTFITLYPITLYVLKTNAMDIHGPNLSQINQVQYIIPKYDSQKCATRMLVRWDLPHLSRLSRVCSIFDLWVAQNDPPNIYIYILYSRNYSHCGWYSQYIPYDIYIYMCVCCFSSRHLNPSFVPVRQQHFTNED